MTHALESKFNEFILSHMFQKKVLQDGSVIYWRDCVLQDDMVNGDQGYIVFYQDGEYQHTYRNPENTFN